MLQDRVQALQDRISTACASAGRDESDVRLMAVTKNQPREAVLEARALGLSLFGENRVQEASEKYWDFREDVELHLIGHLQSNKAKLVPGLFSWVESIDSLKIARTLSDRLAAANRTCSVLLQYNSSGEESKSGWLDGEDVLDAAAEIAGLPGITLRGLMTIGPFTSDSTPVHEAFARTRDLFERLRTACPACRVDTLSMGMTDDLEIAIAEGSTEIRVGTAIFGRRTT